MYFIHRYNLKKQQDQEKLCIINCLKEHRSRTDLLRENLEGTPQQLILSCAYPHKPVNSQKIARYVKLFLGMCGLTLLYLLHTLLEVPLHRQQITWGCLSRTSKKQQGGVGIVPFASTITYQY